MLKKINNVLYKVIRLKDKGLVFKDYFCECGCGEHIPAKSFTCYGISSYIRGHKIKRKRLTTNIEIKPYIQNCFDYIKKNCKLNNKPINSNIAVIKFLLKESGLWKINKLHNKQNKLRYNICPYCNIRKAESNHHIVPRKYKGYNSEENFIKLCFECHDAVEIKTEDWIKSGKHYNIEILRSLIINKGF